MHWLTLLSLLSSATATFLVPGTDLRLDAEQAAHMLPNKLEFVYDEERVLQMTASNEIWAENFFVATNKGGQVLRPSLARCHYRGHVRGRLDTWAALSICNGTVVGAFHDGQRLVLLDEVDQGDDGEKIDYGEHRRVRRSVRGPWNANSQSRYLELLLVVDHAEYLRHNSDLERIYTLCTAMANVMNALYSPLNIYVALVGVVVWTEYDEITLSPNGDTTLTNFLHYRRERLIKEHPQHDNAQLLTSVTFDGGVVGKALKGPMCTFEFSGGVNSWHSDTIGLIATTIAHEIGHNFGMEHDNENCECPEDKCIMSPASSTLKPTFWSSCSLSYLALAFEHGMDYCLRNKPSTLFASPVCGNGFVEEGEECDCGLQCHLNPCCQPNSCKLSSNATCATGSCCDLNTCQFKSAGSLCRRATEECDLAEFCDGSEEFCPSDVFKVDGTECKVGKAFCYRGECRTHSDQCRLLWGSTGKTSDKQCYEQNEKGSRHGNCGYDRVTDSYVRCASEDVLCGMLHCSHLNERLEFGEEIAAILSHSFINSGGRIIPCRTALVDLGLNDVDPGLAPEGAKCGKNRLCVNRRCVDVDDLPIGPTACPENCNGNGVCNSRGHCHCKPGFAPPRCDVFGYGGSVDSGPASNPQSSLVDVLLKILMVVLLIAMLASIVTMVVIRKRRKDQSHGDVYWIPCLKPKQRGKMLSQDETQEDFSKSNNDYPEQGLAGANATSSSPTHALLPKDPPKGRCDVERASNDTTIKSKSKGANLITAWRSISFPASRFRKESSAMGAKYEITVEHQKPSDKNKGESVEMDETTRNMDPRQNPKLAFPHSSSFTATGQLKPVLMDQKTTKLTSSLPRDIMPSSSKTTVPKSSTLTRLEIGRPVLQTVTPSASELISKAPSTGISQSSILTHKKDNNAGSNRASRVMFCDPITLPSPTNPNTPPIIHQPTIAEEEGMRNVAEKQPKETVNIFTPRWTTVPKANVSELFGDKAPMAKAEEMGESAQRPQISNPILQSSSSFKDPTSPSTTTASTPVRSPPPIQPRGKPRVKPPAPKPALQPKPKIATSSSPSATTSSTATTSIKAARPSSSLISGRSLARPSAPPPAPPPIPSRTPMSTARPSTSASTPSAPPPAPPPIPSPTPMSTARPSTSASTTSTGARSKTAATPPSLSLVSSPEEPFSTPLASPLFSGKRKESAEDALSTTSSSEGCDLMKEILGEMASTQSDVYNSLLRRKGKNKRSSNESR